MQTDSSSIVKLSPVLKFIAGIYCFQVLLIYRSYIIGGLMWGNFFGFLILILAPVYYGIWRIYWFLKGRLVKESLIIFFLFVLSPLSIYACLYAIFNHDFRSREFHLAFGPAILYLILKIGLYFDIVEWSKNRKAWAFGILGLFVLFIPAIPQFLDSGIRFAELVQEKRNDSERGHQLSVDAPFSDITDTYIYTELSNPIGVAVAYTVQVNTDGRFSRHELQNNSFEPNFVVEGGIFTRYRENLLDRFMFDVNKIYGRFLYNPNLVVKMLEDSGLVAYEKLSAIAPSPNMSTTGHTYDVDLKKGDVYIVTTFNLPSNLVLLEPPQNGVVDLSRACFGNLGYSIVPGDLVEKVSAWSKERSFTYASESMRVRNIESVGTYNPKEFFETIQKEKVRLCTAEEFFSR